MNRQYTVLSQQAFDTARKSLDAQDAARALARVPLRTFKDILTMYGAPDAVKARIVAGMCQNNEARKRDSVDKNVRNWLSGKNRPTKRRDLWELCFVLGMNLAQADEFLAISSEHGIHWRDPQSLAFAFALREGMSWHEAEALADRALVLTAQAGQENAASYTLAIRNDFRELRTREDFESYLSSCAGNFGALHNTAWRYFTSYMALLESPFDEDENRRKKERKEEFEEKYTVRRILETYFENKLSALKKDKNRPERIRQLLEDWPDEISLSRIRNRAADVPRKVLMLLFLVTDGIDEEEDWADEDEDDVSFVDSFERMEQMLYQCGFCPLDPRNPFDWLMIYCLREDDEDEITEGASGRLTEVLDALYQMET